MNHLSWKMRLLNLMQSISENNEANEFNSHELCELGKWLYNEGLRNYAELPAIHQLEEVHREMHLLAKKVIDCKNARQIDEARTHYQAMSLKADKVIKLLDELHQLCSKNNQ
ncbi:MAG: CZB domain-containing protein [Thermonemataceae bacterium]|nr:CZB domain-containing protein [Thermonemataceae bacterium]